MLFSFFPKISLGQEEFQTLSAISGFRILNKTLEAGK